MFQPHEGFKYADKILLAHAFPEITHKNDIMIFFLHAFKLHFTVFMLKTFVAVFCVIQRVLCQILETAAQGLRIKNYTTGIGAHRVRTA